jgi:hypothetical protein
MSKAENQLKLQTAFSYHQAGNLTRAAELYQDVLEKRSARYSRASLSRYRRGERRQSGKRQVSHRALPFGSDAEYSVSGKLCDNPVPGGRL